MPEDRPRALLLQPPVYDFALFDLFVKPAGLLGVGRLFADAGYDVRFVNGLDYSDPRTAEVCGFPPRRGDGTGKFFREVIQAPAVLQSAGRAYGRYGLHREVFRKRAAEAFGGAPPDIVLIGTGMTYWYPGVREAVRTLRELFPGVPAAAGGVYATLLPDHCRRVCETDVTVAGPACPGINPFLRSHGLPELSAPAPGYRVLPADLWKDAGVLLLNRGCPFSCAYCASGAVSGPFVPGDPVVLFDTAEEMHRASGTVNFAFYDDALLAGKEKVLFPFLERVRRAGYPFSFYLPNAVHISMLDEPTAFELYRGGFKEVRLGLESSSEDFHRRLDEKLSASAFDGALAALDRAGFPRRAVTAYILAGLPEQPAEEVEASVAFAASRGVRVSLSEYSPVPGSSLWDKSVRLSEIDLAGEPLLQNNTFFPMEWDGFTAENLRRIKKMGREHNAGLAG